MLSRSLLLSLLCVGVAPSVRAETNATPLVTSVTLAQCLNLALQQNAAILKARAELQRTAGLIVETRAQTIPRLAAKSEVDIADRGTIESFPGSGGTNAAAMTIFQNQRRPWSADVELTQLVYAGGRVRAAQRVARLTDQIALQSYNAVVADTLLEVRRVFYQVLLNTELIDVREKSLQLLEQQLTDAKQRFDVGAVPQFTVLRAEVEVANARPPLIRARNALRLTKVELARLLAYEGSGEPHEPAFGFVGQLEYQPRDWDLANALRAGVLNRPEMQAAQQRVALQRQNIAVERAGYLPEISLFAGYGMRNATFSDRYDESVHGWSAGARASWDIFDGFATKGRVQQARAELAKAELDEADTRRNIELEVRQAYYDYQQAIELIEAQVKSVEQAEEGLRLAEARFRAGNGTQLDVLSAQTALTEARSNKVQSFYDYNLAVARLERATGLAVRQPE